ncbi:MAG: hypothetical protein EA360_05830 [Balneolaceae bacterium]|nr:MAG: hypothetical protein EA360_05830 [Balneolaceae bacterium]
MTNRVVFYSDENEIRTLIPGLQEHEGLRSAHYNLSVSAELPVLLNSRNDGLPQLKMIPWGAADEKGGAAASVTAEMAEDSIGRSIAQPSVVLINGYYIWKKGRESEHPFFVRLLQEPLLRVAAILFRGNHPSVSMIEVDSNPLIYPVSERMPLLLTEEYDVKWRAAKISVKELVEKSGSGYQLTDYSVLRVSKKVNDPSQNRPELIQPIPK